MANDEHVAMLRKGVDAWNTLAGRKPRHPSGPHRGEPQRRLVGPLSLAGRKSLRSVAPWNRILPALCSRSP
jgi:hypothetical protein